MKCLSGIVLAVLTATWVGCGGSQDSSSSTSQPIANSGTPADQADLPSQSVAQFYEALRDGDAQRIANLLTDKAREETARSGLDIRPQGSTSLSYELGEVDYVTDAGDGAHVKSLWTETDADSGQSVTAEVIWILRRQTEGWRIAGMATPVVEGQLPLLFNFEDPEDMMMKKNHIDAEMAGEQPAGQTPDYQAPASSAAAAEVAVEQPPVSSDTDLR